MGHKMKDKIVELIDIVKSNSPDAEEIVVYGTEEYINKIKDCIPSDVSVKIFPAEYFPEAREELVYIVPINGIKPLKIAFEDESYDPKFEIMPTKDWCFGCWNI